MRRFLLITILFAAVFVAGAFSGPILGWVTWRDVAAAAIGLVVGAIGGAFAILAAAFPYDGWRR